MGKNIVLPVEQKSNPYLHKWIYTPNFFSRKVILSKYSYAFVVMLGGMGTLDELFKALTFIQNKIINNFSIFIFYSVHQKELFHHIPRMIDNKSISPSNMKHLFYRLC